MRVLALILALGSFLPMAKAADGDSIESAVRAVYDVISGPAGERDWPRFRSLFAEGARLTVMRTTSDGGEPSVLTVEDYIKRAGPSFLKTAFYESEIAKKVETYGGMAQVFSTYESRRTLAGKPFERGINSIQLVKDRNRWKVISLVWEAEREGNPIPEQYLPRFGGRNVASVIH